MTDRISQEAYRALSQKRTAGGRSLAAVAEAALGKASAVKTQPAAREREKRATLAPVRARFVEQMAKEGEIVFVLPLPPKKVSPNGRGHWAGKARAVKAYREQCTALMRATHEAPFPPGRVVIDLEFYLCRPVSDKTSFYPRDEDNARGAMKAAQDALKDAAIIPGDGKKYVRVGHTTLYTRAKEHQGFTCVVMTIRRDGDAIN